MRLTLPPLAAIGVASTCVTCALSILPNAATTSAFVVWRDLSSNEALSVERYPRAKYFTNFRLLAASESLEEEADGAIGGDGGGDLNRNAVEATRVDCSAQGESDDNMGRMLRSPKMPKIQPPALPNFGEVGKSLQPPQLPDLGEVGRSLSERAAYPLEFMSGGNERRTDAGGAESAGNGGGEGGFRLPAEQFNQIGKSIVDRATAPINKMTGKDTYEFGDVTRYTVRRAKYLDLRAKSKLRGLMTLDQRWKAEQPEMFDLSQFIDSRIGDAAREYSGRASEVGRILVRKVASEEYTLADVTLLCKILIKLGADFSPVATFLPISLLLQVFDYSIALDLGDRFVRAVSKEINRRINDEQENALPEEVAAPPADVEGAGAGDYTAGDLTKRAILQYTGGTEYSFGDISRKLANDKSSAGGASPDSTIEASEGAGYSLGLAPWKSQQGTERNEPEIIDDSDILSELEECLALEKALIEKLERMQSRNE